MVRRPVHEEMLQDAEEPVPDLDAEVAVPSRVAV
jgi:hypothetical protein